MTNVKAYIALVVAGILLIVVGFLFAHTNEGKTLGANGTNAIENYIPAILYNGGYYSNLPIQTTSTISSAGEMNMGVLTVSGDATINGGTVNITTSNTATSTLIVGCIQFYATSTVTAQKFQASTTPGVMYSQYGTCPNL